MNNINIPKVIHYCWFGGNEKSKLVKKCIDSWKKFCPDYQIIEWNETNYDISKNQYMKDAYDNKKWAFVSDYARLDILFKYGGIYLDTDVELINSIPDVFLKSNGFFSLEQGDINTGLGFASIKENPLILKLLELYDDLSFVKDDGTLDMTTCVQINRKVFYEFFGDFSNLNKENLVNNMYILPSFYFCPLDYITGKLNIVDETIGIHWYGATWMSPKKRFIKKIKRFIKNLLGPDLVNFIKRDNE